MARLYKYPDDAPIRGCPCGDYVVEIKEGSHCLEIVGGIVQEIFWTNWWNKCPNCGMGFVPRNAISLHKFEDDDFDKFLSSIEMYHNPLKRWIWGL